MGPTLRHPHHRWRSSRSRRHGLALRHIHNNPRRERRQPMNHDYTPKEIADATVQASYQHPELRGLDIPPVKAILDALPQPTIMPRIDFARNSYAYQYDPTIMPKKNAIDYLIDAFKAPFNPQPKRKPIVKVQKTQTGWLWTCRICDHFFMSTKWSIIIKAATHHAHNHH